MAAEFEKKLNEIDAQIAARQGCDSDERMNAHRQIIEKVLDRQVNCGGLILNNGVSTDPGYVYCEIHYRGYVKQHTQGGLMNVDIAENRLIVPLDVDSSADANRIVTQLFDCVGDVQGWQTTLYRCRSRCRQETD